MLLRSSQGYANTDYYPLLFHVGASDTAGTSLGSIKRDYRALGEIVKGPGVQVVFSLILQVKGEGLEISRQIWQDNKWLEQWCPSQDFGYSDSQDSLCQAWFTGG